MLTWIPWNLSFGYNHCTGQFTPKMKANAEPRLLSSLVWIDSGIEMSQHHLKSFFQVTEWQVSWNSWFASAELWQLANFASSFCLTICVVHIFATRGATRVQLSASIQCSLARSGQVNLLVICRQAMHEICGEPSTQCSSGQPQCSAHGQRLGEHYPRFPCFRILQCWMIAVWDEWWEDW